MKVGWFEGMWDQTYDNLSANQIMALIEAGNYGGFYGDGSPEIEILLIEDTAKLTDLRGDDWDDRPAHSNASGIVGIKGGVVVTFRVGDKVPDYVAEALKRWSEESEE